MDKKNTFIGILFIAAGIGYMFLESAKLQEQQKLQALEQASQELDSMQTAPDDAVIASAPQAAETGDAVLDLLTQGVEAAPEVVDVIAAASSTPEQVVVLANEFIEVEFTSQGGAIRDVSFLQTKQGERDDYVFNANGYLPALSLGLSLNDVIQQLEADFVVESQSEREITFALNAGNGLVVRRHYKLGEPDGEHPYLIEHQISFNNLSSTAKPIPTIYLNLGTMYPIVENAQPNFLNVGYFNGEKAKFTPINKLTGSSGFLGIGASDPKEEIRIDQGGVRIEWASVKNQFFASVLSSGDIASELLIYPVEAPKTSDGIPARPGITGSAGYALGTLPANMAKSLDFQFFVGPKEFKRLQSLGNEQDEIMQFGFVSFISKTLLAVLYGIHKVIPSWGWSIVVLTIFVKLLFWPLTSQASRSQKRMAKLQGPMSEIREKYKDNPQKLQQETLMLFKQYRVNPVAGCLPILVQMPIFFGLFYMLRTASELRHEPFLWVSDLSQPDTIMEIGGFPINLLPLIMGATNYFQMRMMPVSPTADPMQQKIFKFLPVVMLVFLYNFSSGLVLYWTMQNLLTVVQQAIINRRPDEPLEVVDSNAKVAKAKKVGSSKAKGKKK